MFKKLRRHLTLAFIFYVLTLGQQYFYYLFKDIPIVWFSFGKYVGIFSFMFVGTFIRPYYLRYVFLSFAFMLNFFQMVHLSYYGTQILPNEVILLFTQFHEIKGTVFTEFYHLFLPIVATLIPALVGFYYFKKAKDLYGTKVFGVLFCLYFLYNPIRTYVTGNTWGRQPSTRELSGMNVYLSFSYFAGKILPHKIFQSTHKMASNSSSKLIITPGSSSRWDKIIVVLGESLSPNHMAVYGYEKSTTPFLLSQLDNPRFYSTVGLSGGVSTDISVAFFLNMGFGEVGSLKATTGEHCLFKLAKEKEFSTHFLSMQSEDQLRYIAPYLCAASLDDYKTLEDTAPETEDHQSAVDRDLLKYSSSILDFKAKQLVFLHQRGSHAPWSQRSTKDCKKFKEDTHTDHYDNSVVEFDLFMKQLNDRLRHSKQKILVVYVSDHGEGLGENGNWGHGSLTSTSFEVPVLFFAYNQDLSPETRLLPKYLPHYNLSLYLAKELGYDLNQDPKVPPTDYVIFGNDIDGFAGKAQVSFGPDSTYNFNVVN